MRKFIPFFFILSVIFFVSSCLTVEKKIYTFELTGKNSGTLTIKYVNIISTADYSEEGEEGETDTPQKDFDELLSSYINGDKIESDFPAAKNIRKRLYEENGMLCGEVQMDFTDLGAVRLYKYNKKSPLMLSISNTIDGETFESTNGKLGNETYMNVVFWEPGTKKLTLTTTITAPDETNVSLLSHYKKMSK